jgi:hypothetical protein
MLSSKRNHRSGDRALSFRSVARAFLVVLAGAVLGGFAGFGYDFYMLFGSIEVDSQVTGQRVFGGAFIGVVVAVLGIVIRALWRRRS